MAFIAIMAATPEGRVAKFLSFPSRSEAEAHVARFTGRFPDAFVVEEPAGPWSHWLIDVAEQTVTIDVPPPPPPPPESPERLAIRALAAEIDAGTRGAVAAVETEFGRV